MPNRHFNKIETHSGINTPRHQCFIKTNNSLCPHSLHLPKEKENECPLANCIARMGANINTIIKK